MGIDDFAQALIGKIDSIEMPAIGQGVKRGTVIVKVRQGNRSATFVSPVDGVVTDVNRSLLKHPDSLKQTPYLQNWLVSARPAGLSTSLRSMLVAEDAVLWLRGELQRFRDFVSGAAPRVAVVGETLQDGGQPVDGLLERMDDRVWEKFQKEFLRTE
jgi:glycine cleavage system H lipoate-binding protein